MWKCNRAEAILNFTWKITASLIYDYKIKTIFNYVQR